MSPVPATSRSGAFAGWKGSCAASRGQSTCIRQQVQVWINSRQGKVHKMLVAQKHAECSAMPSSILDKAFRGEL